MRIKHQAKPHAYASYSDITADSSKFNRQQNVSVLLNKLCLPDIICAGVVLMIPSVCKFSTNIRKGKYYKTKIEQSR